MHRTTSRKRSRRSRKRSRRSRSRTRSRGSKGSRSRVKRRPSRSRSKSARISGISVDNLSTSRALTSRLRRIIKRLEGDRTYILGITKDKVNDFLTRLPENIRGKSPRMLKQLKKFIGDLSVDRKGANLEILEEGPLDYYGTMVPGVPVYMRETKRDNYELVPSLDYVPKPVVARIPPRALVYTPNKFEWIHHSKIDSNDDDGTNVFGASGKLILKIKNSVIKIPEYSITKGNEKYLAFFGVRAFRVGEVLPPPPVRMHMVSYRINKGFVDRWAHKHNGMFLEKHAFPHILTTTRVASGVLVVGKMVNGYLILIGIRVNPRMVLLIDSDVIHQDWHFVGKMITTVTTEEEADTVFLVNGDNDKIKFSFVRH